MLLTGKRQRLLLPLLLTAHSLFSQEISPYSRFGLGDPSPSAFSASRGMGRLAAAYRDPLYINFQNPASYSNIALTTLESGFRFTTKNITDGQTQRSYRAGDGFFDYLAFGFPAGSKAGVSLGIAPFSEMSYSFNTTADNDSIATTTQYDGNGRIYQLYAGAAYRYPKSDTSRHTLSLGMNLSYVFGNLERSDVLSFPETGYYSTRFLSSARVNNVALNPGVQYRRRLTDTLTVNIGAYANFPVAVKSTERQVYDRLVRSGTLVTSLDTIFDKTYDNNAIRIPVSAGAGISIGQPNKWMAGAEVKYSIWDEVEPFSNEAQLQNSIEARVGGELRPNFTSQNLFKNSAYRLGAFFNNGYLEIDHQRIMEYGFSFGWSMPIKTAFSRLNFSFETGNRGTNNKGLISETYFRAYIGLTLNDKWFIKPKYD